MTGYITWLRSHVGHSPLLQCGASVIIYDDEGKVLMIHRKDNDCWSFPGGGIEPGERAEDTAKRETFEETGLIVDDLELFGVFSGSELHYIYPNGDEVHNIDIVYTTRVFSGTAAESDESHEACFFNMEELPGKISLPVITVVNKLRSIVRADK